MTEEVLLLSEPAVQLCLVLSQIGFLNSATVNLLQVDG